MMFPSNHSLARMVTRFITPLEDISANVPKDSKGITVTKINSELSVTDLNY